jgi:hypothetical protein
MEVQIGFREGIVGVTVTDHGIGIRPHLGERRHPHNGLGLPMIHRHAWRVTYTNLEGGGTELRMEFPSPQAADPDPAELACAVLVGLIGAEEGPVEARAEVSVAPSGAEALMALLHERLGQELAGIGVERREAADGASEVLAVSVAPAR